GPRGRASGRQSGQRKTGNRIRSASPVRTPLPTQDTAFFQQGTSASNGLSACAVCLGRHHHNVRECKPSMLWNGLTPVRTRRNGEGKLNNSRKEVLCLGWQRSGCERNHVPRHECS
ncbi:hypothetical protein B0H13DRAFT_1540968, partial [Mycena leptocephala]